MQKTKRTGRETMITKEPRTIKRKIGRTTYELSLHFSNTSTESMSDKVMRLLDNDLSAKEF